MLLDGCPGSGCDTISFSQNEFGLSRRSATSVKKWFGSGILINASAPACASCTPRTPSHVQVRTGNATDRPRPRRRIPRTEGGRTKPLVVVGIPHIKDAHGPQNLVHLWQPKGSPALGDWRQSAKANGPEHCCGPSTSRATRTIACREQVQPLNGSIHRLGGYLPRIAGRGHA